MKLRRAVIIVFLFSIMLACSTGKENKADSGIVGNWKAEWQTDPASFPDVQEITDFKMNGEIKFAETGAAEIHAFGFPGCIFSSDTLHHNLQWTIANDTLNLINEGDVHGMTYTIKEMTGNLVRLQLMDDIYLTLTRDL